MARTSPEQGQREIKTLQVCLDHCRDHAHLLAALSSCPVFPGQEVSSLLVRSWALIRTLCNVIGYNASELLNPQLSEQSLRDLNEVPLPDAFEAALTSKVEDESEASIRTVRAKARWGRVLARMVIAQAGYVQHVGTVARRSIDAESLNKKTSTHQAFASGSRDVSNTSKAAQRTSAQRQDVEAATSLDGSTSGDRHLAESSSIPQAEAAQRTSDVELAKQAPLPGNQVEDAGKASAHRKTDETSAAQLVQVTQALPTSTEIAIQDEPEQQVTSPLPPQATPAILNISLSGGAEGIGSQASYGAIEADRSQGAQPNADTSVLLRTAMGEAITTDAKFVLEPAERGYAAHPLPLTSLRGLVHQVLGQVAIESDALDVVAAPSFASPRVDRIDAVAIFQTLFKDDVDQQVMDYFVGDNDVQESMVINFLEANKLGESRYVSEYGPRFYEPHRLAALLQVRPVAGEVKLTTSARRLARTFANKGDVKQWFRGGIFSGDYVPLNLNKRVSLYLGPAGSGKSSTIDYIRRFPINLSHSSNPTLRDLELMRVRVESFDATKTNLSSRLKQLANEAKGEVGRRICVIIDECTFVLPEHLELLEFADQVIFFGDPRQMGTADGNPMVRLFVDTAQGTNRALKTIYRSIQPDIFRTLNFIGYDGHFEMVHSREDACAPFHVSVCRDDLLSRAMTLAMTAAYHIAEKRKVVIATQSLEIINLIKTLVELDARRYEALLSGVSFVPLSNIQGLETDVLVFDCSEVDKYAVDLRTALQFLLVVLGRVRTSISLVRPRREANANEMPPLFSFLMDSALAEVVA